MTEERLKELFLGWTVLDAEEKEMIDDLIIQSDKLQFYKPLMDALRQWELVQDTQGFHYLIFPIFYSSSF